jgi:hypothetical protein
VRNKIRRGGSQTTFSSYCCVQYRTSITLYNPCSLCNFNSRSTKKSHNSSIGSLAEIGNQFSDMVNTNSIYQNGGRSPSDGPHVATEVDGLLAGGKRDSNRSSDTFWKGRTLEMAVGIGVAMLVVFLVGSSLSIGELEMEVVAIPLLGASRKDHHHAAKSLHHLHDTHTHTHDHDHTHKHSHDHTHKTVHDHGHKHSHSHDHKHSHKEAEKHHKDDRHSHHHEMEDSKKGVAHKHDQEEEETHKHEKSETRHHHDKGHSHHAKEPKKEVLPEADNKHAKAPREHTSGHEIHPAEHKARHQKKEKPKPDPCEALMTGVFIQTCISLDGTSVGTFISAPSEDGLVGIGTSGRLLTKFYIGELSVESKRHLESAPKDASSASSDAAGEDEATSGGDPADAASEDAAVGSEDGTKSGAHLRAVRHKHTPTRSHGAAADESEDAATSVDAPEDGASADASSGSESGDSSRDADSSPSIEDGAASADTSGDAASESEDESTDDDTSTSGDTSGDAASGDASATAEDVVSADDTEEDDIEEVQDDKCVRAATISSGPDWIEETGVARYKVQAGKRRRDTAKVLWNFAGIGFCSFEKLSGRHCSRSLNDVADAFKHDKTVDLRAYSSRDLC